MLLFSKYLSRFSPDIFSKTLSSETANHSIPVEAQQQATVPAIQEVSKLHEQRDFSETIADLQANKNSNSDTSTDATSANNEYSSEIPHIKPTPLPTPESLPEISLEIKQNSRTILDLNFIENIETINQMKNTNTLN